MKMAPGRGELDWEQKYGFMLSTYSSLNRYLAEAAKLPAHVMAKEENQIIVKTAVALNRFLLHFFLWFDSTPNLLREEVLQSIDAHSKRLFGKRTSYLKHQGGRPFSLRERLLSLQAAGEHWEMMYGSALNLNISRQAVPIMQSVKNFGGRIDRLLNRQTLRYQYQLSDERLPHQLRYSNDTWHLPDGSLRAQHLAEADFDAEGNAAARAGHDFGLYLPVPHVPRFYLKGAPLVYAGYQTDRDDFHIGTRFDLSLQYDLDWTQRFGTSLFIGYSLGGEWGTQKRDAYHLLGAGLEAFRF